MQKRRFWEDANGYAVVEATILFPIILLAFAGLVLLSMYLPTRAVLQRETQYAATAMATTQSDTWLDYDSTRMEYYWRSSLGASDNVYAMMISRLCKGASEDKAETIVERLDEGTIAARVGELEAVVLGGGSVGADEVHQNRNGDLLVRTVLHAYGVVGVGVGVVEGISRG